MFMLREGFVFATNDTLPRNCPASPANSGTFRWKVYLGVSKHTPFFFPLPAVAGESLNCQFSTSVAPKTDFCPQGRVDQEHSYKLSLSPMKSSGHLIETSPGDFFLFLLQSGGVTVIVVECIDLFLLVSVYFKFCLFRYDCG